MSGRVLFVAVGAAAAVAGLAVALRPSLAAGLSPTYVAVTLVGALALLQAGGAALERLRGERRQADPPEVERRRVFPTPGEEFDERLASLPRRAGRSADRHRAAVRTELREATEATLVRYGGLTPEEATDALGAERAFARRARAVVGVLEAYARTGRPASAADDGASTNRAATDGDE